MGAVLWRGLNAGGWSSHFRLHRAAVDSVEGVAKIAGRQRLFERLL